MTTAPPRPAGWYPDPWQQADVRWWDGVQWTSHARNEPRTSERASNVVLALGLVAVAAVGLALAALTDVSLLTGTGTVWTGAAIAAAAFVATVVLRSVPVWMKIVAGGLVALAVAAAVADEVQLSNKRDELRHVFDAKTLSHSAVERYIERYIDVTGVICNHGRDFTMDAVGQSFTCTDATGDHFTVTIEDPDTGDYTVSSS